jgi:hypothetical protein
LIWVELLTLAELDVSVVDDLYVVAAQLELEEAPIPVKHLLDVAHLERKVVDPR